MSAQGCQRNLTRSWPWVRRVALTAGLILSFAAPAWAAVITWDSRDTEAGGLAGFRHSQGRLSACLMRCPKTVIREGSSEPILAWSTERWRIVSFSALMTDPRFNPVWGKCGWRSSMRSHVSLRAGGTVEKIPATITSSPWTANTTAGRSFVARKSVKGNRTRTTSPRWYSPMRVEIVFLSPFGEGRFGELHHLKRLETLPQAGQHGLQFRRGQLRQQVFDGVRGNIERDFCHPSHLLTRSLA